MLRALTALMLVPLSATCGVGTPCTTEGDIYGAHELHGRCCSGLSNVNLMFEPSDDYEGDDLPEGCAASATPPDIMVCVACGDGLCGEAEHFCNCPEDCPSN